MTLRVLYIHPVGGAGGASKSLVELYRGFPDGAVDGTVITPRGTAAAAFADAGLRCIEVRGLAKWDDTRFGHYRGVRWAIVLRELAYWPATIVAIRRAAQDAPFDIVHCNEITALAAAVLAKKWVAAPLAVHIRSLQRGKSAGVIGRRMWALARREASALIAIDEAVRRTLPDPAGIHVVHNGMAVPENSTRHRTGEPFAIGVIGVLHRSKGIYELLEAVRLLRDEGVDLRLVVVGDNIRKVSGPIGWLLSKLDLARDVRGELEAYVDAHDLRERVEFTGFVTDVAAIYRRLDAVCFPSHLDAPGRPVFEASLFGLPSIVAMRDPTDDVIVPDVTGLCIDVPTPRAIADAIRQLAEDRGFSSRLGSAARERAVKRFDRTAIAARVLDIYRNLTAHA